MFYIRLEFIQCLPAFETTDKKRLGPERPEGQPGWRSRKTTAFATPGSARYRATRVYIYIYITGTAKSDCRP